jgi:hypothetical protein
VYVQALRRADLADVLTNVEKTLEKLPEKMLQKGQASWWAVVAGFHHK